MNKYGLTENECEEINSILKNYPEISEVILFGSRALNTFKATSDIDFAVKGKSISSIIGALIDDFEESSLIYTVDVVEYTTISSLKLFEHINTFGCLFYRKGWTETTLGDVATIKGGKRLPKGECLVIERTDHPYIRITDLDGISIKKSQLQFVTSEVQNKIKRYIVNTNDVIISIVGTIGLIARIDESLDGANLTENCVKLTNLKDVDFNFLFYDLRSRTGQYEINKNTVGAVQKKLPIYGVEAIQMFVPPLTEQKAIADVLSSFDEKIELLREQNETLETLAQTLFKEWFVNFNYPNATGEMQDSEFGEIPKGWRVGNVGEILELPYGKALKTNDRTGTGYPVYGSNGVVGYHKDYLVEGAGIIVGRKGTMGKITWCDDNFYPIDTTFYVTDKLGVADLYFHYFLLLKYDYQRLGSDSAVPGLNRNSVYIIDLLIPSTELISEFNNVVKPMFLKSQNNRKQLEKLEKIRDTLLPKLLNGSVRVKGFGE